MIELLLSIMWLILIVGGCFALGYQTGSDHCAQRQLDQMKSRRTDD